MLQEIRDKTIWEEFVNTKPMASFLQSWSWGEFQEISGNRVRRLGLLHNGRLVAAGQLILEKTKLGLVGYVPYGPVLDWHDLGLVKEVIRGLIETAKTHGADFVRIDPRIEKLDELANLLKGERFKKAPHFVQAEYDWVLDLQGKSDQELLGAMRKTTRYLIKKGDLVGVKISSETEDLTDFLDLLQETTKRQHFVSQGPNYLTKQFEILKKEGIAKLFVASFNAKPQAAAIVMFYGDNASYVHGASVASRDVPASYRLQWEVIKTARHKGFKFYSLWGVAPTEDHNHPWYGISLFKKGFGGGPVTYIGAWDYPLSPKYHLVAAVEKYRKYKNGL